MLKLKLQYFGHLLRRADSLEKTLILGKIEGRRRRGRKMVGWHHQLNGHEFVKPGVLQFMGSQRVGHDLVTELQQEKDSVGNLPRTRRNIQSKQNSCGDTVLHKIQEGFVTS